MTTTYQETTLQFTKNMNAYFCQFMSLSLITILKCHSAAVQVVCGYGLPTFKVAILVKASTAGESRQ